MILLAALALSTAHVSPPTMPVVQARATVRIISGERLQLKDGKGESGRTAREILVRIDGVAQRAQLIEFE